MKTVKQVTVYTNDNVMACRYDVEKGLLYKQNRSKDIEICLDDFLNRMNTTIKQAKEKCFQCEVTSVGIKEAWPVLNRQLV